METIGSAERSTDVEQMRDTFHTITDGAYSELLYKLFTKERVEAELEKFLEFDFFPRVGGGIGMTRMIAALDKVEVVDPIIEQQQDPAHNQSAFKGAA